MGVLYTFEAVGGCGRQGWTRSDFQHVMQRQGRAEGGEFMARLPPSPLSVRPLPQSIAALAGHG